MQAPVTNRIKKNPIGLDRDHHDQAVGDRGDQGGNHEQAPGIDPIGQGQQRADDRADDESGLHARGEQGGPSIAEAGLGVELGNYRGRRKPRRQRRYLEADQDRDRASFADFRI